MTTHVLALNFTKDKRMLEPGGGGALGRIKEHNERTEGNGRKENENILSCSLSSRGPVWMPPPACRMEPLPIITRCILALQLLASTVAATRGPHLSVRVALRKEKAAPGPERPLFSQWAGGDTVVQEKGG